MAGERSTYFAANVQSLDQSCPSTTDQDLSIQGAALKAAGCEVIRAEKRSGTTTEGRDELRTLLEFLRTGDVLMVTRIDRLARSIGDLQDIVRQVKARGASLKATKQPIDTSTPAGKCFLAAVAVDAVRRGRIIHPGLGAYPGADAHMVAWERLAPDKTLPAGVGAVLGGGRCRRKCRSR
jgi:hypothetical protein